MNVLRNKHVLQWLNRTGVTNIRNNRLPRGSEVCWNKVELDAIEYTKNNRCLDPKFAIIPQCIDLAA